MAAIPEDVVTQADLEQWYNLKQELAKIRASEMLLRKRIFSHYFRTPVEGTNTAELEHGYELKGKYPIDRDIDEAAFNVNRERFAAAGLKPDSLVRWKPELVLRKYRELTAEEQQLFDECLTVKPGSPSLDIMLPHATRQRWQNER